MMVPVETKDPLVSFIYQLLRDGCTFGEMEKVVRDEEEISSHAYWIVRTAVVSLSNEHAAAYAKECAKRLRKAWGPYLQVPHLSPRQWELIEEALEDHVHLLRQSISDALKVSDDMSGDVDAWRAEIEEVQELDKIVYAMKHLGDSWDGEKA
jgi:precorrin-4 methylase